MINTNLRRARGLRAFIGDSSNCLNCHSNFLHMIASSNRTPAGHQNRPGEAIMTEIEIAARYPVFGGWGNRHRLCYRTQVVQHCSRARQPGSCTASPRNRQRNVGRSDRFGAARRTRLAQAEGGRGCGCGDPVGSAGCSGRNAPGCVKQSIRPDRVAGLPEISALASEGGGSFRHQALSATETTADNGVVGRPISLPSW